jgi:hypothetical protein
MNIRTLRIERIAQIETAQVEFGDLTVLVGPQATGKSIFLQFFKLLVDTGHVLAEMKRYGLHWEKDLDNFLDIYLGEGMRDIWRDQSSVSADDQLVDLPNLVSRQKRSKEETVFFIPAQRVLTLGKGWPRPFTDYSPGDPFTVRDFSEKVRLLLESEIGQGEALFPQTRRIKSELRKLLNATVFARFQLRVDKHGHQKRLVLGRERTKESLPFMVWSAGQREFVPLLLGFYWLLPPTKVSRRAQVEWVVIEEIEMGLHPKAISAVMLLVLELLARGYRVCLSTHSPHLLDVVWALGVFQKHNADPRKVLELFAVPPTPPLIDMAKTVLDKRARVYYFDPATGRTKDISNLDPGVEDAAEAGWGGLTEFSGRVADVVASVVNGSTE